MRSRPPTHEHHRPHHNNDLLRFLLCFAAILCGQISIAQERTDNPTAATPTSSPTLNPSTSPTKAPSSSPTPLPTLLPTASPTLSPTASPSLSPTGSPTVYDGAFPFFPAIADPPPVSADMREAELLVSGIDPRVSGPFTLYAASTDQGVVPDEGLTIRRVGNDSATITYQPGSEAGACLVFVTVVNSLHLSFTRSFTVQSRTPLPPNADCEYSQWTGWSLCPEHGCGPQAQARTRRIVASGRGRGVVCDPESLKEERGCAERVCQAPYLPSYSVSARLTLPSPPFTVEVEDIYVDGSHATARVFPSGGPATSAAAAVNASVTLAPAFPCQCPLSVDAALASLADLRLSCPALQQLEAAQAFASHYASPSPSPPLPPLAPPPPATAAAVCAGRPVPHLLASITGYSLTPLQPTRFALRLSPPLSCSTSYSSTDFFLSFIFLPCEH